MPEGINGDLSGIDFHLDVSGLFSEESYQRDLDQIFRKSWLAVGHDYDIPNAGDFRTRTIPGLNYNILVVRGKDDRVRAFHNICRHRGNMLVCKEKGSSRQGFSCGYHGWTYNIDGSVRGITDRDQFPPYGNEALGLKEIRCEVRHSFIFINFDAEAASLDDWLAELAPDNLYEGFFHSFEKTNLYSATIQCNWNIVMDAFSEAYHTLFVHKNTATDYLGGDDNKMRHVPAMDIMDLHARHSVAANPSHKWADTETLAYRHTNRAFPSFDSNSEGLPPGLDFGNLQNWAFDIVKFFPNLILLTGRDWFIEGYAWPSAADETIYEWNIYHRTPKTYGERVAQEFSYVIGREIACEDLFLLERQQQALQSEAVTDYFLSFQELVVAHHYRSRNRMFDKAEG
ncbi:aromatic ring-hydroxylating oxygenase subunit alpha [Croceicoccus bisphenolivorans]|uniref:aromatic ring-hydroxylating oxygenase subunit alpha n=1 Tax=Croceicoccus bisphenolivorans TaxID=1783232 RepID=UPI000836B002|nr:aromatic ring-hydroxylating dioxygenase subunit alpha [Croceicoccus bisphenolivorans]